MGLPSLRYLASLSGNSASLSAWTENLGPRHQVDSQHVSLRAAHELTSGGNRGRRGRPTRPDAVLRGLWRSWKNPACGLGWRWGWKGLRGTDEDGVSTGATVVG